jgi:hypothetical protein
MFPAILMHLLDLKILDEEIHWPVDCSRKRGYALLALNPNVGQLYRPRDGARLKWSPSLGPWGFGLKV